MNKCIVCDKVVENVFGNIIDDQDLVCYECIGKLQIRNKKIVIEDCEGIILYYYNDFFKDVLFKYKGGGDYLLKDFFLVNHLSWIKRKYKNYKILLAPSNYEVEDKRGFNHLEEIFKILKMPIIKCFKKEIIWKQSSKKLSERTEVQNVIKIDKSMLMGVKKALIVDDVLTSGSTIRAMISQIPSNILKKVLVLSSNCRILKNEIV